MIALGSAPVSSFDNSIAAELFISTFDIVPSTILLEAIVMSVGNAPPPNFVRGTESFANFDPAIFAPELISELTISKFNLL